MTCDLYDSDNYLKLINTDMDACFTAFDKDGWALKLCNIIYSLIKAQVNKNNQPTPKVEVFVS